jgi:hypothetical protein
MANTKNLHNPLRRATRNPRWEPETWKWVNTGGGAPPPVIPQYAIVNRNGAGEEVLNRDGNYILADPTPRTS